MLVVDLSLSFDISFLTELVDDFLVKHALGDDHDFGLGEVT